MTLRRNVLLTLTLLVAAVAYVALRPSLPARGAAASVTVSWGDSTALVSWTPTPGAAAYQVSLVRQSDNGIMEQFEVPATQLVADAQGIWPNETYFVAVAPVDSNGVVGMPVVSTPGQSVPIDRSAYNGFLDQENVAQGSIDPNLWDIRSYVPDGSTSTSFVNNQLHYHLETGDIYIEQSMVGMTARVPVDFTNRTAHIHGEVDFHGDAGTWFTVNLTPVPIAPQSIIDTGDREVDGRGLPELTLFDGQPSAPGAPKGTGDLKLAEDVGGGHSPVFVVPDMVPDFSFNNVRNTLDLYVSTTHVKVVVDGHTLADVNLPTALPFSTAYLNLTAENYPKVAIDQTGSVPPCDQVGGECNIWHLDNWGFDAPAGVQPQTTVDFSQGCTPAPSVPDQLVPDVACDEQTLSSTGDMLTYHVPVADASQTRSVQVLAQQYGWDMTAMQHLQVRLNGGNWQPFTFLDTAQPYGELGSATLPSGLQTGDNVVQVRATQVGSNPGTPLANLVLQQVRTVPFVAPPLPPEPAPIGQWGPPGPPQPSPTPTSTPTPMPINNVPCTVTLPTGQQTGTCTGTFTPGN